MKAVNHNNTQQHTHPNTPLQEARHLFKEFLRRNHLRHTPEREKILSATYYFEQHFDADSLYAHLRHQGIKVSRATVYNTIELLVKAGILLKHQFGEALTRYEWGLHRAQHDHLICSRCRKIVEFCDPRLQPVKASLERLTNFIIQKHTLIMWGLCPDCQSQHQ